jgi:hypothetical protein
VISSADSRRQIDHAVSSRFQYGEAEHRQPCLRLLRAGRRADRSFGGLTKRTSSAPPLLRRGSGVRRNARHVQGPTGS